MNDSDHDLSAESLGVRLRRFRLAKGISQSQLAAALGVSTPSVSGWEMDRVKPKARRVHRLAGLLGVSASELLGMGSSSLLQDQIARSREDIARIAGTTPDKVRILIEL